MTVIDTAIVGLIVLLPLGLVAYAFLTIDRDRRHLPFSVANTRPFHRRALHAILGLDDRDYRRLAFILQRKSRHVLKFAGIQ